MYISHLTVALCRKSRTDSNTTKHLFDLQQKNRGLHWPVLGRCGTMRSLFN